MPSSSTSIVPIAAKAIVSHMQDKNSNSGVEDDHFILKDNISVSSNQHMMLNDVSNIIGKNPIHSIKHLAEIISSTESTITFLRSSKLLATSMTCSKCPGMELGERKVDRVSDKVMFFCRKCKKMYSIRSKSFLKNTRCDLRYILKVIYFWSIGVPSFLVERMVPEVSDKIVQDWFSFCRDICIENFKKNPVQFNEGKVRAELQIDESLLGKKQKYHKGKIFKRDWLFGISDPSAHTCHVELVEKRNRETLEDIIVRHVDPSTEVCIVSDGWAAYSKLQEMGYKHEVVVHEREFKNEDGFHTNSIESLWSQIKIWFSSMHGVKKGWYQSYLQEFMYRYNHAGSSRGCCMQKLFQDIAIFYDVTENHSN